MTKATPTSTLAKLAASSLVLGITMVGCKPAADASRPLSAGQVANPAEQGAGKAAAAAIGAARSGNLSEAVRQAELAVSLEPRDAGYRGVLADTYLKAGRFDSAAATYRDVVQLNPDDPRARLSLALTQIALGRSAEAIATLADVQSRVPAADLGLALALAGDKEGALRILLAAAREEGAEGRVRQNLALTYALAGDWTQARAIAAQDIAADELDARMAKWAQFAQPRGSYDQVATLLGVTPVQDAGQPTRLALSVAAAEPVQVAAVQAPMASEVPVAAGVPAPEPVVVAQAETFAPEMPAPAPVLAAAAESVESVLPQAMAQPVARAIRAAATAPASLKGRYVVQIGAFASTDRVEQAWNGAVGKLGRLANYVPASTRFNAGSGTLTRLSVGGFPTRTGASSLCNSLRRAGGVCFVRETAGDAPVRWAGRNTRNG